MPLHGKDLPEQAYYVRGPLSNPAALNALSQHGAAMLHLVAGLGYDWACMSLIKSGANINLQVCQSIHVSVHQSINQPINQSLINPLIKFGGARCNS